MYNKKYRLEKIEQLNHYNPIYEDVEGKIAYPAYFNVGERGWFLYIEDNGFWGEYAHRIHTSVVKSIDYVGDEINVITQNTRFVFKLEK